ncbi:MAG TPA: hypothetical protein PKG54_06860 [Phycisphaerae bacterium]|mgnify:CR=1 FL=1|jgi:hypothetical protein|nr:hypothetical protein [Phycisphaerae bacterium]HOB74229.1 hypothetical protein [Phycisphaerae bacterium]HOJ55017.1 hypothetical protein [Phycisphaerae bacterium]HOL26962.1 hypothetical protein [Phycisphaerae bacterium]HPP21391.1 hypothetical protein [Phycisphaerae bacterium]
MSTLGSNLVGSILQTPLVQGQLSTLSGAERAQIRAAQRQQVAAASEADSTVDTSDNNTQVHTDSEGQGSQGRAFSEQEENPQTPPEPAGPEGEHLIDLEA